MKKLKYLAAGFFMLCAVMLFPQKSLAAESVKVTTVQDITDVQTVSSTNFNVGTGYYENVVQFTLPKPAYVYVSAYSTVMHENYSNLGNIADFAVYSDANCSNMVLYGKNEGVSGNEKKEKYMCLDAGTYWVRFAKGKGDSYNDGSNGQFRLSVAAQYLNVTATKNGSWARAKSVATDKNVTGFLSNSTRTSWYKFKVTEGTTAKLAVSLENPLGEEKFPTSHTGITVYRANHQIVERFDVTDHYYERAASKVLSLKAGTYYIGITGDSSYTNIWDETKLVSNDKRNMGVVNLKVTTLKKATLSKLTNVKGKKAQVTYKAVSGAKGYEVQYATDKKFKKGVKTVKANAKTTKVTISKLKKGSRYYVRVRAYKNDEDGNKITGNWSAVKNVKISK